MNSSSDLPYRRNLRLLATFAFAILVSNLAQTAIGRESRNAALVVATDKGDVRGVVAKGVENFLKIPYAAPPVGALRWQPPQSPAAWTSVRSAASPGPYCTQPEGLDSPDGPSLDEDCLHVNVQRPIGTRGGQKLPVYVYIHGGGLTTGSGVRDGQEKIVRLNGVIGVTMGYRLGAMGFLALQGLSSDSETGNYGLLDQQAALRWVQRNIAAFGGDPDKVTIGGESAGGYSVCTHLVAPGSQGVFSKAIIQSGSCVSRPRAGAEEEGEAFAEKLGCDDLATRADCLRGKSVAHILSAQAKVYVPTRDTLFLPVETRLAIQSGEFARVPVLMGATKDEMRSFTRDSVGWSQAQFTGFVNSAFGANAPAILQRYPFPASSDPAAVAYQLAAIQTDAGVLGAQGRINHGIGGCGDAALRDALSRYVQLFAYEFSHRTGPGWFDTPGYVWGAGHAAELPYLYPAHDKGKVYASFRPEEVRLSDQMVRRWGSFVKTANPNHAGQEPWPDYASGQMVLSLDASNKTVLKTNANVKAEHRCDLWDSLAGALVN